MAIYIPELAAPIVMREMKNRLVVGRLATDISNQIDNLQWQGAQISFPVFERVAVASDIAAKGSVAPVEVDGSSSLATIKHVSAGLKWHQDTIRQSGKAIADLGLQNMGDAMATKLDGDLVNEAVNNAVLRSATAAGDKITSDEIEAGFSLFGDKQDVSEFSGIVIHSKLFPSILNMNAFSSTNLTYTADGNGVVRAQIVGYYRGVPVFLSNNNTLVTKGSASECKTIILKKGGLGYAMKKRPEFKESYNVETFYTTVVVDSYYATKVLDPDKVCLLCKTISSDETE